MLSLVTDNNPSWMIHSAEGLTFYILMGFPIQISTMRMGWTGITWRNLPINVYSFPEVYIYLGKQCRPWWNATFCGILSKYSMVTKKFTSIQRGWVIHTPGAFWCASYSCNFNPLSATYSLQQATISNFAAFSKITNEAWYFMTIVCWQTILM